MDARKYKYRPLDPSKREIRLLNLLPSDRFSSQIKCSISTTTLDDDPEYTALSYRWGDSSNPIRIVLEDDGLASPSRSYLWVGSNLHAALRRIRKLTDGTRIWIDAICIDQDNTSERNHQVGLMREIYEKAEQTIIWLGDAYKNSGLAIGLIKAWAKAGDDFHSLLQRYPFAFSIQMWNAVDNLFKRPWWRRIWVYQEYLLSREPIFVCGSELMTNQELEYAEASWRTYANNMHQFPVAHKESWRVLMQVSGGKEYFNMLMHRAMRLTRRQESREELHALRFNPEGLSLRMSLLRLVVWTKNKEATDPRDKLFALLGIDEVQDVPVTVDYNRSIQHVYTEFAVKHMKTKRDLEILSIAGVFSTSIGAQLASWVPDLCNTENMVIDLLGRCRGSGNRGPIFKIDDGNALLTVKGFVCDIITECIPRHPGPGYHEKWIDLALNTVHDHPTCIPKLQAFFRTMIGDTSGYGFGRPEFANETERNDFWKLAKGFLLHWSRNCKNQGRYRDEPMFQEKFETWAKTLKSGNMYAIALQFAVNAFRDHPVGLADTELLSPFLGSGRSSNEHLVWPEHDNNPTENEASTLALDYEILSAQMTGRRSLFTSGKGYIGLGRTAMRPKDKICVVFGCPIPLVLRKSGHAHILIGSAYVYGMMKGEMIPEFENGAFKEQDFVIK